MRISDWSSDVCSSDLALAKLWGWGSGFRRAGECGIIRGSVPRGRTDFRSPVLSQSVLPCGVDELAALIRVAGSAVMDVYSADFEVRSKADESPVTEADERAEQLILQGLARLSAGIPVIRSEEHTSELQSLMRTSYAV